MISDDLRRELIAALVRVPLLAGGDAGGRTILLTGIPQDFVQRNPENAWGDVVVMVAQMEQRFGPGGEWYLLRLLDNALPLVAGSSLAQELLAIRQELVRVQGGYRSRQVHPADMAQVHLFDLRQPVMVCVGLLPATPQLSGFVIGTPTHRLLRYFCDSLKHRGADSKVWSRDEVAPPRPPLLVEPPHTTAATGITNASQARQLLTKKHVIWAAYVHDPSDADLLWQGLTAAFAGPLARHLIVVFGMPPGAAGPPAMAPLPSPVFTKKDIADWLDDIASGLAWQAPIVQRWTSVVVTDYGETLPIDGIYERLEYHSGLVSQHRTEDAMLQALADLEVWGG